MKKLKYLIVLILVSCSSIKVNYDYDNNTEFIKYKTYNFYDDVGKGLNDLDIKRVRNNIAKQLNLKGMVFSDTPDIYINFFSEKWKSDNQSTIDVGLGGNSNVGFGISGIPLNSNQVDQLITIDFIDSDKNELIWQGEVKSKISENISPINKEKHFEHIIGKVLNNYPPKK